VILVLVAQVIAVFQVTFQLRAVCVAVDIGKSAITTSCGVPFQDNLHLIVLAFIFSSFVFVTA
jgi:hypothetical protein